MNVKLIEANDEDLELIMAWRSNELIYRFFAKQKAPLSWEEHFNFWTHRKDRIDWMIVLEDEKTKDRKVGTANVSELNTPYPTLGLLIGEIPLWSKGVGTTALLKVLDYLKSKGYEGAKGWVDEKNLASQRFNDKCGLKRDKNQDIADKIKYVIKF